MTYNEAILVLRSRIQNVNDDDFEKAFEMAVSALTEIQKYHTLGKVEEIEPYIRLAEKLNVCDLVRENANLHNKLRVIEAKQREYKNADNQEKPLCKIGDTVYFIYTGLNRGISEGKVNNINITEEGIRYYAGYCSDFDDYDIGKTVFLTEAQAEAALQKM